MGREIRRVVPNWEHPKKETYDFIHQKKVENYQPMHDEPYIRAINEWIEGHQNWEEGRDLERENSGCRYYAEWAGNPPEIEYYRPYWDKGDMTWYQVYETVSEGTPVTPPFETKEELIEYLVKNGDFWDQHRGHGGWERKNAEHFVESEWAPSGILVGGQVKAPRDIGGDL